MVNTSRSVASFLQVCQDKPCITQRDNVPDKELMFVGSRERPFFEQSKTMEGAYFDKCPDEKRCSLW